MKRNEIVCDLCGVTVATKEDLLFSRFKTKIPYIKVPYNYIGAALVEDGFISVNARAEFHICENCLECIKKDIKEVNAQKTAKT